MSLVAFFHVFGSLVFGMCFGESVATAIQLDRLVLICHSFAAVQSGMRDVYRVASTCCPRILRHLPHFVTSYICAPDALRLV